VPAVADLGVTDQADPERAYDPTLCRGSAAHYLRGRPPYSAMLADAVRGAYHHRMVLGLAR